MSQKESHLQPGTLLFGGRYKITRFIAAGGFGCTYEAEFVPMRSLVAIKEFFVNTYCRRDASGTVSVGIDSQAALVDKLQEKFRREAQRLFKLQHPNIVRVSDIIEENGTSYYVMDYIDGRSLKSIIDSDGPLSEAQAVKYIRQVIDALEYVHGENMLHLDIKPGNIMIDGKDNAILIDFGVSKQYDEEGGHNTSTIMGKTRGFSPPEQSGNSIRNFTPATDIYALGATLYCALTGITPPSSTDIICGLAQLQPLPDGLSETTSRAIQAMMEPVIHQRPQTIAEVRQILDSPAAEASSAPVPVSDGQVGQELAEEAIEYPDDSYIDGDQPKSKKWIWLLLIALLVTGVCAYLVISLRHKVEALAADDSVAVADTVVADVDSVAIDNPSQQQAQSQASVSTVVDPSKSGMVNGHQWVDMGTSVKWASRNLGAGSQSGYGDYFAWGEVSPKDLYDQGNSLTYDKEMGGISGNSQYDAATHNWGVPWRTPTKEELEELLHKCRWTWVSGKGYKVKAKNGNELFFPTSGGRLGAQLMLSGTGGYYWSATPADDNQCAYVLCFNKRVALKLDTYNRYNGFSIRPVTN